MPKKRKPARYRPRKEYKFWLYTDLVADSRLMEFIAYLKTTRQFATYIKRGLKLLWTLQEGDLTYLFELFPQLAERLNPPPAPPDKGDLERLIQGAVHTSVKAAMLEMPSLPATIPAAAPLKPSGSAPPALAAKNAPVADASTIADNFLAFIQ